MARHNYTDLPGFEGTKRKRHPAYVIWVNMRQRCLNPNNPDYHYYGGAGISICVAWSEFSVFAADMGPRPLSYTLDIIDPYGNYEPSNCRWISRLGQAHNKCRPSGGVYFDTYNNKWAAQLTHLTKRYKQRFKSKQEAEQWLAAKRQELGRT